jgi:hypothetical protein
LTIRQAGTNFAPVLALFLGRATTAQLSDWRYQRAGQSTSLLTFVPAMMPSARRSLTNWSS